jgi:hypothetical protein
VYIATPSPQLPLVNKIIVPTTTTKSIQSLIGRALPSFRTYHHPKSHCLDYELVAEEGYIKYVVCIQNIGSAANNRRWKDWNIHPENQDFKY